MSHSVVIRTEARGVAKALGGDATVGEEVVSVVGTLLTFDLLLEVRWGEAMVWVFIWFRGAVVAVAALAVVDTHSAPSAWRCWRCLEAWLEDLRWKCRDHVVVFVFAVVV